MLYGLAVNFGTLGILDGNLEEGAHLKSEIGNMVICLDREQYEIFSKKSCFPSLVRQVFWGIT